MGLQNDGSQKICVGLSVKCEHLESVSQTSCTANTYQILAVTAGLVFSSITWVKYEEKKMCCILYQPVFLSAVYPVYCSYKNHDCTVHLWAVFLCGI